MDSPLLQSPSARTFTIADLMELVRQGQVRLPDFQRAYRWEANDVIELFDSIYRGYPIGSLLLWDNPAPHETIEIGTLRIEGEATNHAFWVVDGQQRITSLAGALLSEGEPSDNRFSIYFDLEKGRFTRSRKPTPPLWLPLNRVLNLSALLRWLGDLQVKGVSESAIATAEDLARRVRQYQVPAYVVETDDESTLRTIFDRLNNYGKSLKSSEVFHALHGGRRGAAPEDLRTLAKQVSALGFGTIDENSLLRAVLALRGSDIYRDFHDEFDPSEDPTDAFAATATAMERMIGFLRSEAHVPHVKTLPYRYVIPVLARFFDLHPQPSARTLVLLRRWLWRDALTPGKRSTSVTEFRAAVRSVDADEEASVQRLLKSAPQGMDSEPNLSARLNEARARANAAIVASWRPRSLLDGSLIDVAGHMSDVKTPWLKISSVEDRLATTLANRLLHPPTAEPLGRLILDSPLAHEDPVTFSEVLASHALSKDSIEALRNNDHVGFLEARAGHLVEQLGQTAARLTEPDLPDRSSIGSLIVDDDD